MTMAQPKPRTQSPTDGLCMAAGCVDHVDAMIATRTDRVMLCAFHMRPVLKAVAVAMLGRQPADDRA